MATNRLEILKTLVAQNPADSFLRYGLAMEHRNSGDLERAIAEFRTLIASNADYVAAYQQGGQTLELLRRFGEAREMYRNGIEAATRAGDLHARSEIQATLDLIT